MYEQQCLTCTCEHLMRVLDAVHTILRDPAEYVEEYVLKLQVNLVAAEDHTVWEYPKLFKDIRELKLEARNLLPTSEMFVDDRITAQAMMQLIHIALTATSVLRCAMELETKEAETPNDEDTDEPSAGDAGGGPAAGGG